MIYLNKDDLGSIKKEKQAEIENALNDIKAENNIHRCISLPQGIGKTTTVLNNIKPDNENLYIIAVQTKKRELDICQQFDTNGVKVITHLIKSSWFTQVLDDRNSNQYLEERRSSSGLYGQITPMFRLWSYLHLQRWGARVLPI